MLNSFQGIGNIVKQPESRFTGSGTQVVTFTVACDHGYGDNKKTEFVNCVTFNKLAAIVEQYAEKGKKVYIQGAMQTDSFEGNDGVKKYYTKIVVNDFKMLSQRDSSQQSYEPPPGETPPF